MHLTHAFRWGTSETPQGRAYLRSCELVHKHGTRAKSELGRIASIGEHLRQVWAMIHSNPEFLMDNPDPSKSKRVTTRAHHARHGHRRA